MPQLCKHDLRKNFSVNRLVKLWNSLTDDVISACSVRSFKRHSDLLWRGFSCIMIINLSSNTGNQCKNSISLVFC